MTRKLLISCKRTDKKSISITAAHLAVHTEDAMNESKTPMWEIEIAGKHYCLFRDCDVERIDGGVKVDI